MTRRTSSFQGHTLKRIAVRTGIRLPENKSVVFSAPEPEIKYTAKQLQYRQIIGNNAKPSRLETQSLKPGWRFPHRAHPDPTASS
jgi:hypothetical protein